MKYQKIKNLSDNTSNQPSKFRTKNWIEINGQSRGTNNTNSDIRFKTRMQKSSLCDYSDVYILVKGGITITGEGDDAAARQADERNKGVIFKNCAPFINCKSEINNIEIDNTKDIDIVMPVYKLIEYSDNYSNYAPFINCKSEINNIEMDNTKDIDIVMPMYKLIEYSDNYSKASGSLWQYYRNEPNDNLTDSESLKSKINITGKTPAAGNTKAVEIMVPLKYFSNFWEALEILLFNCEINLILTWS